ncbi:hypothetical protein MCOR25_007338 [Pyricularia grisea]|nr:hypothetical protein MCOR25_007338 [Pyricularia grisea]
MNPIRKDCPASANSPSPARTDEPHSWHLFPVCHRRHAIASEAPKVLFSMYIQGSVIQPGLTLCSCITARLGNRSARSTSEIQSDFCHLADTHTYPTHGDQGMALEVNSALKKGFVAHQVTGDVWMKVHH